MIDRFSSILWTSGDIVEFRAIRRDKNNPKKTLGGRSIFTTAEDINEEIVAELKSLNDEWWDIYAGANPRVEVGKRGDANVAPGIVVWADWDYISAEDAGNRLAKHIDAGELVPPTMIVNSGHGFHLWWALNERQDVWDVRGLVHDIAVMTGGDVSAKNPERIMRVPGFKNHKPPQADCFISGYNPENRYDFSLLRAMVKHKKAPDTPVSDANGQRLELSTNCKNALKWAMNTYHGRNEGDGRDNEGFKVAVALRRRFALELHEAKYVMNEWNKLNDPPMERHELAKLLRNGMKHGTDEIGTHKVVDVPVVAPQPPRNEQLDKLKERNRAVIAGELKPFRFRWEQLNFYTGGISLGEVTVIGGPAGVGKSYFTTNLILDIAIDGRRWAYLPLEGDKAEYINRMLAVLELNYDITGSTVEAGRLSQAAIEKHGDIVSIYAESIEESPLLPPDTADFSKVASFDHNKALKWVIDRAESGCTAIIIDPITKIDFDSAGKQSFKNEMEFIGKMQSIATYYKIAIILVTHTTKGSGWNSKELITGEDLAGSAGFKRHSRMVLILNSCRDGKTSMVYSHGTKQEMPHNRTIFIDKANSARGAGKCLAFNHSEEQPLFEELGLIISKKKSKEGEL